MADITIQPDEQGAYELVLEGGAVMTIEMLTTSPEINPRAQIIVHDATTPLYARPGTTVTPQDPKATIITPGTWAELHAGQTRTIALINQNPAIVSVARV